MSSKRAAARVGGVLALSMSVFAVTGQAAQAVRYDPQQTLPFAGLAEPESVAMDAHGNLYVADGANGRVAEISSGADGSLIHGTMSTVVSGLNFPFGLALDGAGNLYVSSGDSNAVYEVTPGSDGQWSDGVTTVLSLPDLTNGGPLATDANGDLFVVDPYTGDLIEHPAGSGAGDTIVA